jgi:hypothetical protein
MFFVIVVDTPIVHQHAHCSTRSSTMFEMTHSHAAPKRGPTTEGDQDECTDDLLKNCMKNKKQKNKWLYIFWGQNLLI